MTPYYIQNDRVYRDGETGKELAIIYSAHFGAGWSTWNDDSTEMRHCAPLVTMILDGASYSAILLEAKRLFPDACLLCTDLAVAWVPCGEYYYIKEYDGCECVITQFMMEVAE